MFSWIYLNSACWLDCLHPKLANLRSRVKEQDTALTVQLQLTDSHATGDERDQVRRPSVPGQKWAMPISTMAAKQLATEPHVTHEALHNEEKASADSNMCHQKQW